MAAKDTSYEAFLRSIQPVILGLTSCNAEVDRQRYIALKSSDGDFRTLLSDYRSDNIGSNYFDMTAEFTVAIKALNAKKEPEEKSYLHVRCAFYGHFHVKDKPSEKHVERFIDSEARIFFVPYMRQFIADMTARMAIQPVMIPLAVGTTKIGSLKGARPKKRLKE